MLDGKLVRGRNHKGQMECWLLTLANFLDRMTQLYESKVQTIDALGNTSGTGGL